MCSNCEKRIPQAESTKLEEEIIVDAVEKALDRNWSS
jgi:hypothetical protein